MHCGESIAVNFIFKNFSPTFCVSAFFLIVSVEADLKENGKHKITVENKGGKKHKKTENNSPKFQEIRNLNATLR